MSTSQSLALVVFCVCTLVGGSLCLWRPTLVRDYTLWATPKWYPFRWWVEGKSYLAWVRFTGVFVLLMPCLLLCVCIWGK